MSENNTLTPGDWVRSVRPTLKTEVEKVRQKVERGYRLLPPESTVAELIALLDKYDREYRAEQDLTKRSLPTTNAFAKSPKNVREEREAVQ